MNKALHLFIMAGGAGTRLWPFGRKDRPKQVLPMPDGKPLLQRAVDRARRIADRGSLRVIAGRSLETPIRRAAPGLKAEEFLPEPEARDTGPCVVLALADLGKRAGPDDLVVFMPADHRFVPEERLAEALKTAAEAAAAGERLWLLGIRPTRAATGFGWLALGDDLGLGRFACEGFVEKPGPDLARTLLEGGKHLWNAGILVARRDLLERELAAKAPDLGKGLREIREWKASGRDWTARFRNLPRRSIDHALLELGPPLGAVAVEVDWKDVGGFEALASLCREEDGGNRRWCLEGGVARISEGGDNFVLVEGKHEVLLHGVDGLVVVHSGGRTLILPKERSEEVRNLAAESVDSEGDR